MPDPEYDDLLRRIQGNTQGALDKAGSLGRQVDTDKRNMLEAAALAGTAGIKAYQEAKAGVEANRQAALARATERARLVGGPEAQGFGAQVSEQFDRGLANLASAQAAFEANQAARTAANADYFEKVRAAEPIMRSYVAGQLARQAARARAKGAGGGLSDAELRVRLTGATERAKEAAEANLAEPVAFPDYQPGTDVGKHLTGMEKLAQRRREASRTAGLSNRDLARELGMRAGIEPNRLYGLVSTAKENIPQDLASVSRRTGVTVKDVDMVRATPLYKDTEEALYDDLSNGELWETVVQNLQRGLMSGKVKKDRTYKLIVDKFLPFFREAGLT